ncbi:TIGR02450 family Trp-rich protein [Paraferrimonas sedimenticola]|uniref:TIGR02450 family Trp-rich protein n=1 Tax=Paraferrimonas sedimenticola TaxID=375674 RepID=A0AA37RX91_9GAMM|nr:TIGR02450 family Trp-rich protein [Paraferrimonas sedimenticola]GLP96978.1 hypothetical protein GCM10007895_22840 [Paraferrimonas sedimenticola]
MNRISPKALLNSKWTKREVVRKEKHFVVTEVEFDEQQAVSRCVISAVMSRNEYEIDWRELKQSQIWRLGWH